jgi:hypothetical protein
LPQGLNQNFELAIFRDEAVRAGRGQYRVTLPPANPGQGDIQNNDVGSGGPDCFNQSASVDATRHHLEVTLCTELIPVRT